jgi:hypothetical protein
VVDWQFTETVSGDRAARLHGWKSFDEIITCLLYSAIDKFWWEPFRSPRLKGCNRASFTMMVSSATYDAFFNSPKGYRAQYASAPSIGDAANRTVLEALERILLYAVDDQRVVRRNLVLASLHAIDAKIWIDESEVEDQLSDPSPAIVYEPWQRASLDGQGLRAPIGTRLEVKGGWLDSDATERRDPMKARRSSQIYETGFS